MKSFFLAVHRRWLLGVITLTLLSWGGVYYMLLHTNCPGQFSSCDELVYLLGGFTWGFGLKSIFFSSVIFFFLPARAFYWWKWFALVAIPIGVWDIITTKFGSGLFSSPDIASNIDGEIFLGISIFIAVIATIYDFFEKRKANPKTK